MPSGQRHIGIWFSTSQRALWPHVPGQGSTHLLRTHAFEDAHSVFNVHSGRQAIKGSPWYSGMQEHCPLLQIAFRPQGEGLHGSSFTGVTAGNKIYIKHYKMSEGYFEIYVVAIIGNW